MRTIPIELLVLLLLAVVTAGEGVRIATSLSSARVYGAGQGGVYLAVLGSLLAVLVAYQIRASVRQGVQQSSAWGPDARQVIVIFGLLAGYVVLIGYLGYMVSVALFFVAFFRIFSSYRWIPVLAGSLAMAIGSAYLWAALTIMLPTGFLPWP